MCRPGRTARYDLLLGYPRLFGYVFNPLFDYFCYGSNGNLALLIYEVRNTFGEIHSYILPVEDEGSVQQCQAKEFYVSPFMEMQTQYRFSIAPPDHQVKVKICRAMSTVLYLQLHSPDTVAR